MLGLTPLGVVHTAISLIALIAGIAAIVRHGEIDAGRAIGRIYVWATVFTCLTGFGIFQHGGFGKAHALGVLTLVALAVGAVAGSSRLFGRFSRYVEVVAYSTTLFFHTIPGMTETFTRLPPGDPWFSGPDDPALQKVVGFFFLLLLVGCTLQVRRLRSRGASRSRQ